MILLELHIHIPVLYTTTKLFTGLSLFIVFTLGWYLSKLVYLKVHLLMIGEFELDGIPGPSNAN